MKYVRHMHSANQIAPFQPRDTKSAVRSEHSGQIFSFVQRSRSRFVSHALLRSQFLLILTNQVPSLCLLPRVAAKLRPFLTVLTTIPKKNICMLGYVDFHQNFNGRRFSIPQTISAFGIPMPSLKLADLWYFENHCSHFLRNKSNKTKQMASTN